MRKVLKLPTDSELTFSSATRRSQTAQRSSFAEPYFWVTPLTRDSPLKSEEPDVLNITLERATGIEPAFDRGKKMWWKLAAEAWSIPGSGVPSNQFPAGPHSSPP